MSAANTKADPGGITPPVHLEFIQNQLERPGSPAEAAVEVEQYHRALFLHHHAVEWEQARLDAQTHSERLAFLESQLKATELGISKRSALAPTFHEGREDVAPNPPWHAWDRVMFGICSLAIVLLIAFGVSNISFNLLESGLVTFRENPIRAYLWTALLPVGALAVKVGWDSLEGRRARQWYFWLSLALGVLGVFLWMGAYASVYPSLSKGIEDQIASLSVSDANPNAAPIANGLNFAGTKWVDVLTVAGQATAEIFLSAVLGMYLTNLYMRHRPVRLARDPASAQLHLERNKLEERIARERQGLSMANGKIATLENRLAALVAYGKSMFHREVAQRQDQTEKRQIIMEQLSDHLRDHLSSLAPNGQWVGANAAPSSTRANGG